VRVVWAPLAITRAAEIAAYIAADRPGAAERWVTRLFKRVAVLGHFPETGQFVPEVERPDIREVHLGVYRIIYRLESTRVAILTVRHGRRLFDPTEIDSEVAG
jgi:plasmid stabilization system protein ParE